MLVKLSNTTINLNKILAPVPSKDPSSIRGYATELTNRAVSSTMGAGAGAVVGLGASSSIFKHIYKKSLKDINKLTPRNRANLELLRKSYRMAALPVIALGGLISSYPSLVASEKRHFGKQLTTPGKFAKRTAAGVAGALPGAALSALALAKNNKKLMLAATPLSMLGFMVGDKLYRDKLIKKHA